MGFARVTPQHTRRCTVTGTGTTTETDTDTPSLCVLRVPVWTFICRRTFYSLDDAVRQEATGGHKQVISDVKLKESSKDKLIYSTLQLKNKLIE